MGDDLIQIRVIPLFNDSAFGIAPSPRQLFDYAGRLLGYQRPRVPRGISVTSKQSSGYYVIRDDDSMCTIDCGEVGPDYQPGHAHCDTLSYELSVAGRRVIVDSGVHDYENSARRHYARSTRAHNTVIVDGMEQSVIWGIFRVARRARPLHAGVAMEVDGRARFEGAHDGYRRLRDGIVHRRVVEYSREQGWRIDDELRGAGRHCVENYIHLAPDLRRFKPEEGNSITFRDDAGNDIFRLVLPDNMQVETTMGEYFPEFGVCKENTVVRLHGDVDLPFRSTYRIIDCLSGVLPVTYT